MLKSNKPNVSLDDLRSLMVFEESTGFLRWRGYANRMARPGSIAGSVSNLGYVKIKINRRLYAAHRLVWFYVKGVWPNGELDHINGNRSDNRIENLREATRSENCGNSKHKGNATGFKGVTKVWGGFIAVIMKEGKKSWLGRFDSPEIAAIVYDITALELFGKFAKTNF